MQTLLEGAVAQPNDAPGTRDRNRLRIEVDRWQGVCAPSVDANTEPADVESCLLLKRVFVGSSCADAGIPSGPNRDDCEA